MGKSSRLRLADVRSVFRLVGECRELGHDPHAWLGHLLRGIPSIIPTQQSMAGDFTFKGGRPWPHLMADAGWPSERSRAFWLKWARHPDMSDHPALVAFAARPGAKGTCTRRQLVADRAWDLSPHVNEVLRPAGIDEGLVSSVPLADGREHLITLCRSVGDRPFGRRDRGLLRLFHGELTPHLGRALTTSDDPGTRLTPRLRQVLRELLGGDGEKQIARRLEIAPDTLHGYVKQVYRAFNVRGRAELMALHLRRHLDPPPWD